MSERKKISWIKRLTKPLPGFRQYYGILEAQSAQISELQTRLSQHEQDLWESRNMLAASISENSAAQLQLQDRIELQLDNNEKNQKLEAVTAPANTEALSQIERSVVFSRIEASEQVRALQSLVGALDQKITQYWVEYVEYSGQRLPDLLKQLEERIWKENSDSWFTNNQKQDIIASRIDALKRVVESQDARISDEVQPLVEDISALKLILESQDASISDEVQPLVEDISALKQNHTQGEQTIADLQSEIKGLADSLKSLHDLEILANFQKLLEQGESALQKTQSLTLQVDETSNRVELLDERTKFRIDPSDYETFKSESQSAIGALENSVQKLSKQLQGIESESSDKTESGNHNSFLTKKNFDASAQASPTLRPIAMYNRGEAFSQKLKIQTSKEWDLLRPRTVLEKQLIRVGGKSDGGYVMLDDFGKVQNGLSFGAGDDVSWDLDLVTRAARVFLFDHTVSEIPEQNERVVWRRKGVGPTTQPDKKIYSIDDIIESEGLTDDSFMILKIDIEGDEWEVLSELPSATYQKFTQILVEFHGLTDFSHEKFHTKRLKTLRKISETHTPFHIHGNNWGAYKIIGGKPIPDVVEVSWASNAHYTFGPGPKSFPREGLDAPNNIDRAEYEIVFK